MKNLELAVFDIAGTTVKDKGNVAGFFILALRKFGFEIDLESVNRVMGFRKKDAIRILLEQLTVPEKEQLLVIDRINEEFTRSMIRFYETDPGVEALPNAEDTFTYLRSRGVKVALNTGFTRPITDVILKRLNWNVPEVVDAVICSDEAAFGRPHPAMIQALMVQLKVGKAENIMKIGDTQIDIEEGRNAGCGLVISVTTGACNGTVLKHFDPDFIIHDLSGIKKIVQHFE